MIEAKKDCFAYVERKYGNGNVKQGCFALNCLYCKSEECKFYKPIDIVCKECRFEDCKGCPAEGKIKIV